MAYAPFIIAHDMLPEDLRSLTAALLEDLYDLVLNFGAALTNGQVHRLDLPTPKPVHVTVVVPPALRRAIMVSDMRAGIRADEKRIVFLDPHGGDYLIWAEGIAVDDVRAAIRAVDEANRAHIGPDGRRQRIVDAASSDKLSVADVFAGDRVVRFTDDADPEVVKRRFDRPEDVVHVGEGYYCHRDHYAKLIASVRHARDLRKPGTGDSGAN